MRPDDSTLILPGAPPPTLPPAPAPAERLALRVIQVGAVAVMLAAATWKVFELDRFFVPKDFALHLTALLAGLLTLGAVRRASATRVDVWLLGYLALGGLSAALATNPWLAARALGISVSGVVLFWAARGLRRAGLAVPLTHALALAVVVAAATSLLQTYGVRTDLFSLNRAPGGTLGNRNFVAHLAALGLPLVLLSALRARRPRGALLAALGVAACAAVLVLTRSRAAWLGGGAALALLMLGTAMCPPLRRDWRLLGRMGLMLALGGGGVAAALALPNALRWKTDTPYLETARGVVNYQEGSGRGRLVQYRNSLRMALRNPVLGVGPGNWPVAYPEFATRRDPSLDRNEPGTTSNPWPSSDWVALLAERGVPAFGLLVLAWTGIAVGAWRRLRAALDSEQGMDAVAVLAMLAGVAVVGAFDAVQLLAWPALVLWTALGALWSPERVRQVAAGPAARVAAMLVLALLAGASAARAGAQLVAMGLFANAEQRSDLLLAARLDPGNYRVRLRLAQRGGRRAERCEHAHAAHALLPSAAAARRLADRCD